MEFAQGAAGGGSPHGDNSNIRCGRGEIEETPSSGRPRIPLLDALKKLFTHGTAREAVGLYAASAHDSPGSFNLLKSCAGITLLSLNEDKQSSLSIKLEDWLIEKGLEQCSEHLLPPFMRRMFVPTVRTVEASSQPVLDHLQKILTSVSTIEGNSVEAVRLLEKIASSVRSAESQVRDGMKTVKESSGNEPEKPVPETVLSEFIKILRALNNGPFVQLLNEVEKLAAAAVIPVNLKKQLIELKLELKRLPWMVTGVVTLLGGSKSLVMSDPIKVDPPSHPPSPDNLNLLVPPTPGFLNAAPAIPFNKFGSRATDLLYSGYVENRLHAEVKCGFMLGTQTFPARGYPSVLTKIISSEESGEFSLLMRHKGMFGDGVKAAVSFVLPLGSTSMAEVQYLNEKFSLNAEMGLHVNPSINISGSHICKGLCVGGAVTFGARDGLIVGAEAGVTASKPEWGNLSGLAKMLRDPQTGDVNGRAVKILYSQDLQKNTIAADLAYNYEENTIVITAGVEHRVDDSMLLKARYRSDGAAACMVEFQEGLAGSTFRAMVQADVYALKEKLKVGISITTDPTK